MRLCVGGHIDLVRLRGRPKLGRFQAPVVSYLQITKRLAAAFPLAFSFFE